MTDQPTPENDRDDNEANPTGDAPAARTADTDRKSVV